MRLGGWKSPTELTATDSVLEDAESRGRINPGKYNAQGTGRTQVCPQCGRKWTLRCRPDQWGYWYQDTGAKNCRLMLFCGPACVKTWAEEQDRQSAENFTRTRYYEVWRLVRVEGLSAREAAEVTGMSEVTIRTAVAWVEAFRFREIEWLRKHKEVGA